MAFRGSHITDQRPQILGHVLNFVEVAQTQRVIKDNSKKSMFVRHMFAQCADNEVVRCVKSLGISSIPVSVGFDDEAICLMKKRILKQADVEDICMLEEMQPVILGAGVDIQTAPKRVVQVDDIDETMVTAIIVSAAMLRRIPGIRKDSTRDDVKRVLSEVSVDGEITIESLLADAREGAMREIQSNNT